tara:strand:- start:1351 stop:1671 length:321 start_codon:yes stop_codon:yes gene_type:complete
VPGGLEDGFALFRVKSKPDMKKDPHTHYLLSLCQENEAAAVIELIKKTDELHQTDPATRGRMRQAEYEILATWRQLRVSSSTFHRYSRFHRRLARKVRSIKQDWKL